VAQQDMVIPIQDPLDPFPYYRYMREHHPIAYSPDLGRWEVYRYAEVLRVLDQYQVFSSNIFGSMENKGPFLQSIVFQDPPAHSRIRSLVTPLFSPGRLKTLEARITQIVDSLLDQVLPNGRMDVVTDFAYPLPIVVIAEMLGVPIEDREQFKRWSDSMVGDDAALQIPAMREMDEYFGHLVAIRRMSPKSDIISTLVRAQNDHKVLDGELIGFIELLLAAGYETTAHLLCNIFRCFDAYPEVMAQTCADPGLLPAMIEETLRYLSPIRMQTRVTREEAVFALADHQEVHIPAGHRVALMLASANRDEHQFPDPDRFLLHRSPNRHVAFGRGDVHFCLGAPLGRMEARIALERVCRRLGNVEVDHRVQLEAKSSHVGGVKHLPITFEVKEGPVPATSQIGGETHKGCCL